MSFYGAETIALDAQGTATERSGANLASTGSRIARIVASAPWEGTDADAFRLRSFSVSRQIEDTSQKLTAFGTLLREQAEEQDRCSSATGFDLPALPDALTSLLGGLTRVPEGGPLTSSDIGFGGLPGMGGGVGAANEMGRPIDPGMFEKDKESSSSSTGGVKTNKQDLGPGVERSDKHVGGYTKHDDGSTTFSYTFEEKTKVEVGTDANGGSVELVVGETAAVRVHPDGSKTVILEASIGGSAEMHAELKGFKSGVESSAEKTQTMSVTLPPGMPLTAALGVSPYDPSTLPPGASVTVSNDLTATLSGQLGYKSVGSVSLGQTESSGDVTTVAKDASGNLTVDTGPGSASGIAAAYQIGPDSVNVKLEGSDLVKTTSIDHGEFDNSEAGAAAAQDMILGGGLPAPGTEGVTEAYHDDIRSKVDSSSISFNLDNDSGEAHLSHDSTTAQVFDVKRTYPDGSWVQEERRADETTSEVNGDRGPYAVKYSSSEGEPRYELIYPTAQYDQSTSYHDRYDVPNPGQEGEIRIMLTQDEMDQIMENEAADARNQFSDELDVLVKASNRGPDGADQLTAWYQGYEAIPVSQGGEELQGQAPGEVLQPGEKVQELPQPTGPGSTASGRPGVRPEPSAV